MTYCNPDEVEAGTAVPENGPSFNNFTVVVHAMKVVQPAEVTKEETIYLTNIDQMLVVPVESFFVYLPNSKKSSESVFWVLEDALAKVLVPYHFMAGRFEVNTEEGRLQVKCNRAGVGFVVASSEQTIEDLGDLKLMNPGFRKLVPSPPGDNVSLFDDFLLMVQVTRFRCGGFTVGFRMSHSLCDGTSSAQFFRSFCKLARGAPLTEFPDLDRTILKPRDPPAPEFNHPECFRSGGVIPNGAGTVDNIDIVAPQYITKHIPMSLMEIQTLKTIAMADGSIKRCSSFEVTIAHFWQARTRSLEFAPDELTNLLIAVDFRAKMHPPIQPTFCGNTIISAHVSALASEVAHNPLSYCVAKIQEAVARIDERYVRSALDWLQLHGGVPAIGSAKDMLVSAWWKFPFYEHDFGWGKPVHSGPPSGSTPQFALIVSNGTEDGGLLLLVSFQPHEMVKFERYLKDI
ncbi:hypothetical protein KC19_10G158200 [Ceratodon purpureus]|uniref:Omega-hydroxypalmitate O-feruloyl transferase n=1 Tax=Ceratodon purpureus TaxID=3225 RepID=A0A8T0GPF8_CERPU|nr:hypothetical protein KC19_10G158200 [Ceratodon purpureus]